MWTGITSPISALMRLSACYKAKGHRVEMGGTATAVWTRYWQARYSPSRLIDDYDLLDVGEVVRGGTGYDIAGRLPEAVENSR